MNNFHYVPVRFHDLEQDLSAISLQKFLRVTGKLPNLLFPIINLTCLLKLLLKKVS